MPDDIVTFGSPRGSGRAGRSAGEVVRSLFLAAHADLVRVAWRVTGDQAAAERIVQQACLRLWRDLDRPGRRRATASEESGDALLGDDLRRAVLRMAMNSLAESGQQAHDAVPGPPPGGPGDPDGLGDRGGPGDRGGHAGPDTGRAWAELVGLRAEYLAGRRQRRRRAGGTAAAALAVAVAVVAAIRLAAPRQVPLASGTGGSPGMAAAGRPASQPRLYPGAVAARIPITGVLALAGDRTAIWVIRALPPASGPTSYQLARIDVGTGRVAWRRDLGRHLPDSITADAAGVWLTTGRSEAAGQVERFNPVTGRPAGVLHLPAGPCTSVTLVAGRLIAQCYAPGAPGVVFLRVSPVTGHVTWRASPTSSRIFAVAAGPRSVWYDVGYSGIYGLIRTARGGARRVIVYRPHDPVNFAYTSALTYADGAVWVLNSDENVAEIDPATGRVTRSFSYRSYDPAQAGGLDFFAVSDRSLWFLDDGYPFSGVLRVSTATGRQSGGVPGIPPGACLAACSQIYATPGSVWVPTWSALVRIVPARVGR
ncbi:MAG: sigma factor [Streptosporangiaceae bacterium]